MEGGRRAGAGSCGALTETETEARAETKMGTETKTGTESGRNGAGREGDEYVRGVTGRAY